MKKEILEGSENYTCTVVKIAFLNKHPNADRLQTTTIHGNNVITDMKAKVGDIYLYFPPECQISADYAVKNDLIRRKTDDGKVAGGFLEQNRRIRVMKLRGEPSAGMIMPLSSLYKIIGTEESHVLLEVGDEFNVLNGIEICRKYVIPERQEAKQKEGKVRTNKLKQFSKLIEEQFHLHYKTSPFAKNAHLFKPNDELVITQKMHGTSVVLSNVLCKRKLNWKEKVAKWFGIPVVEKQYDLLYSSRTVVKNALETVDKGGYYKEDIWGLVFNEYKYALEKGITLYGEICGFLPSGGFIQKGYTYGNAPGKWSFHVYRITFTNEDGVVTEFTWNQIEKYAKKYNLPLVKKIEHYYPTVWNSTHPETGLPIGTTLEEYPDYLVKTFTEMYLGKTLPEGVPDEGICVRNESTDCIAYKLKDFAFLGYETKMLDEGEQSIEDTQSSETVTIEIGL